MEPKASWDARRGHGRFYAMEKIAGRSSKVTRITCSDYWQAAGSATSIFMTESIC